MKNVYGKELGNFTRLTRHYQDWEVENAKPNKDYITTDYFCPRRDVSYDDCLNKLGQLEDIEQELGIDLVSLLNTKVIYIAKFSYWRWNIDSKQQCKKEDKGAQENKEIKEKKRFCVDFINKEIVVIETILASDDFDYKTKITRFPFSEYGKTWAFTREELEK